MYDVYACVRILIPGKHCLTFMFDVTWFYCQNMEIQSSITIVCSICSNSRCAGLQDIHRTKTIDRQRSGDGWTGADTRAHGPIIDVGLFYRLENFNILLYWLGGESLIAMFYEVSKPPVATSHRFEIQQGARQQCCVISTIQNLTSWVMLSGSDVTFRLPYVFVRRMNLNVWHWKREGPPNVLLINVNRCIVPQNTTCFRNQFSLKSKRVLSCFRVL